jgi:hypothetical protein
MNIVTAASLMVFAAGAAAQTVVQGPVARSGVRYYVLEGGTYAQMRTMARAMGGDLARIDDAGENAWIQANLTAGGTRKLYLGLNDEAAEGTFVWSDGGVSAYTNWAPGEPGNSASNDYAALFGNDGGRWYLRAGNMITHGLVKITGDIRVPEEIATITSAVTAARTTGFPTIRLSPGFHLLPFTVEVPVAADFVRIVGSGRDATTVRTAGDATGFDVRGWLALEDLSLVCSGGGHAVTTSGTSNAVDISRCVVRGERSAASLIRLDGDFNLDIEASVLRDAQGGVETDVTSSGVAAVRNTVFAGVRDAADIRDGLAFFRHCTFIGCGGEDYPTFRRNGGADIEVTRSIVTQAPVASVESGGVAFEETCFGPFTAYTVAPGSTNFKQDPRLDLVTFEPRAGSPCIDRVSPEAYRGGLRDAGLGPRFLGASVDLGAVESNDTACPADFNEDGFVDFFDYDAFVEAFETGC